MTVQQLHTASHPGLDYALHTLSSWIRDTDNFTGVIGRWAQTPPEYELLHQGMVSVSDLDPDVADSLDMLPVERVRHRACRLQLTAWGETVVLAEMTSAIAQQRLPKAARDALEEGVLPLGQILRPYGVRRHTHRVDRVREEDEAGRPRVLRVRASLTVLGVVVAAVDEVVHQALLDHRTPANLAWLDARPA
ncbi:hypothetical protein SUDANB95_07939 (plasmid) [Actinosynnema sp. ALI-1.44]